MQHNILKSVFLLFSFYSISLLAFTNEVEIADGDHWKDGYLFSELTSSAQKSVENDRLVFLKEIKKYVPYGDIQPHIYKSVCQRFDPHGVPLDHYFVLQHYQSSLFVSNFAFYGDILRGFYWKTEVTSSGEILKNGRIYFDSHIQNVDGTPHTRTSYSHNRQTYIDTKLSLQGRSALKCEEWMNKELSENMFTQIDYWKAIDIGTDRKYQHCNSPRCQ